MPRRDAAELAGRLGRQAEAVCRRYLPSGRRKGRYWLVGDVRNRPGRSLFVRLTGPDRGKGAAGHWTDAATGEHGDLLDVIRHACGLVRFADVLDEACRFLSLPPTDRPASRTRLLPDAARGSRDAAGRLFAVSRPIAGTLAETYLQAHGIALLHGASALRFHPRCLYRADNAAAPAPLPAMIAAVTDGDGSLTGVQRTWLAADGRGKASIDTPRRAMGDLLGHAVRFGRVDDVMAAGEGIETMLSLRGALPIMPMAATLSAAHLAAFRFPATLRRLYVACDRDPAGQGAATTLRARARDLGIEAITLLPRGKDFNDDLALKGVDALRAALRVHIVPEDVARVMQLRP